MATTISSGVSFALTAGQSIAIRCSTGSAAKVNVSWGGVPNEFIVPDGQSKVFGPFVSNAAATIAVLYGRAEYTTGVGVTLPGYRYFGATAQNDGSTTGIIDPSSATVFASSSLPSAALNFKRSNTANFLAPLTNSRWLFFGDSYFSGSGTAADLQTNARANSFPLQAGRTVAETAGVPVNTRCYLGVGGKTGTAASAELWYNNNIDFTGDAVPTVPTFRALGYQLVTINPGSGSQVINIGQPFDQVEVVHPLNGAAQGNLVLTTDTAATTSISTASTTGAVPPFRVQTVNIAGNSTLTLTATSLFTTHVLILPRRAAVQELEILNAGVAALQLQEMNADPSLANQTWAPKAALPYVLPTDRNCTTFVDGWYNDRSAGRTISQAQGDLAGVIAAAKLRGDVIYTTYQPLSPATISVAVQDQWTQAMIDTALAADIPVIDFRKVRESYQSGNNEGKYFDDLHNSSSGALECAQLLARIRNAASSYA